MYKSLHCLIIAFILLISFSNYPQTKSLPHTTKVMTLGVFHFSFPNLDVVKIDDRDKIDVLKGKYQAEIKKIVEAIKAFKPTHVFVEVKREKQAKTDSLYKEYREGHLSPGRDEVEQLGFRIAKELDLRRVDCVDTWGKMYKSLDYLFSDTSARAKKFGEYYFNNPDTVYLQDRHLDFSGDRGIIQNLIEYNNPEQIKKSLGSYLIGHFKYEEIEGDYTGADFEAGRWFDRNLRIFRNVQRFVTKDTERILVIFGAGHMNVLNYLFECSPQFELVSPEPYLKRALNLK